MEIPETEPHIYLLTIFSEDVNTICWRRNDVMQLITHMLNSEVGFLPYTIHKKLNQTESKS
jgi:hypothetical protein